MTKTILLQGGPKNGMTHIVDINLVRYTVLRSIALAKNAVLLGFEKGFYDYNGKSEEGLQVFEWQGWEGNSN